MSAVARDARVPDARSNADTLNLIDEQHPWLGLDSFTEETRQFFFGREDEVAELARRVQRKTLAILFGQSGLGKTSILRAGIVPRLRKEGFCPVYVRVDYSRESPAPSQQIKQEIFRATEALGRWTRPGSSVPGESLWEFLHHRDDVLVDERGNALVPLLIFDQFEEIFTLGQMDDFGRERAAEFIADLADLVENRPPRALEMMLENEDSIVERFDFDRADYRILIALREDYLAHLEGLKAQMPSITQNRMRLARMTGHQALAAVVKPGGRLVSEEVAESIVRFVAGGSELRNAEVEPSLLSLVCRELNNARIAQGRAEISADLLAGSRDTILNEFYERALADQPPGVRQFIEDEMLTESGFRESLAEERVLKGFAAANAMATALPALVNRRLLRIEERLDARRVELTHDVLCAVVKASRDARLEREAREEAERQLAAQRAREEATKRSLVRTRYVAAASIALAIVAVGGAIFGYVGMNRAQETRAMAEGARAESEKLILYLLDDFYLELEPVGRVDVVADLAKRALDYYAALPGPLRTPDTERNRSVALVRYSLALRNLGKIGEAEKAADEAATVLARLRAAGDASEAAITGLALAYSAKARSIDGTSRFTEAREMAAKAADTLRPVATKADASVQVRRAYGFIANQLGFLQMRQGLEKEGERTLEAAREAYRGIAGPELANVGPAAAYIESTAWRMEALERLDRRDEALKIGEEGLAVAAQILERRPGHMGALRSRALIATRLGAIEGYNGRLERGLVYAQGVESDWETFLKLDPGNAIAWNNLAASRASQAFIHFGAGRVESAIAKARSAMEVERRPAIAPGQLVGLANIAGALAETHAEAGEVREAELVLGEIRRIIERAKAAGPATPLMRGLLENWRDTQPARIALALGRYEDARKGVSVPLAHLDKVKGEVKDVSARIHREQTLAAHGLLAEASYRLGDFAVAERAVRRALEDRPLAVNFIERLDASHLRILLALAVARQGRHAEAASIAAPEAQAYRALIAAGADAAMFRVVLAEALLANALASPGRNAGLLAEGLRILDALPGEMRRLRMVRELREEIAAEARRR